MIILGVLYPFREGADLGGEGSIVGVFEIVVAIFSLYVIYEYVRRRKNVTILLVIALYPIVSSGLYFVINSELIMSDLMRYYSGFTLFVVVFFLYEKKGNQAIYSLFNGVVLGVLISVALQIEGIIHLALGEKFVNIYFPEPNFSGSLYVMCFVYLVTRLLYGFEGGKWLYGYFVMMSIVFFTISILTYSRGSFAAIFIGLLLVISAGLKSGGVLKKVFYFLGISTVIFFGWVYLEDQLSVTFLRFGNISNPYSGGQKDHRFDVWAEYLEVFVRYPWGVGIGNIRLETRWGLPEHNTFLQTLSIFGFMGVYLCYWYAVSMVGLIRQKTEKAWLQQFALWLCIAYLPLLMTLNLFVLRHFWIFIAILFLSHVTMSRQKGVNHSYAV